MTPPPHTTKQPPAGTTTLPEERTIEAIAHARNGFRDKFGIPRQPDEASAAETRIVFTPKYRVREALRGMEGFSHLWLIWGFHELNNQRPDGESDQKRWHATVRPPRLGGNRRMGVFATRSPYRPNALGLSSVRLLRIEESDEGPVLVVSGADLMDGTPVYDIKPYLAYSDSHPDATEGFATEGKKHRLHVVWTDETADTPPDLKAAFGELAAHDPRPGYQHDETRIYHLDYGEHGIDFRVEGDTAFVLKIRKNG